MGRIKDRCVRRGDEAMIPNLMILIMSHCARSTTVLVRVFLASYFAILAQCHLSRNPHEPTNASQSLSYCSAGIQSLSFSIASVAARNSFSRLNWSSCCFNITATLAACFLSRGRDFSTRPGARALYGANVVARRNVCWRTGASIIVY